MAHHIYYKGEFVASVPSYAYAENYVWNRGLSLEDYANYEIKEIRLRD